MTRTDAHALMRVRYSIRPALRRWVRTGRDLLSILLVVLLVATGGSFAPAAAQERYVPAEESRIWIEGSASVRDFTCGTGQVDGEARLDGEAHLKVVVPVAALECGREGETEDMHEAMHRDEHPEIHFDLGEARVSRAPATRDVRYAVHVTGDLTIAGETRPVELVAWGDREGPERAHAQGSVQLRMTDFGIDPPSAMMGLIEADDEIEVHFEIAAQPAEAGSTEDPRPPADDSSRE